MLWFRVDNRLVHGQIIEAWLPYTGARHLVVANDDLAADDLRQQIISLAVPQRVTIHFIPMADLPETLRKCGDEKVFVLLADCDDAAKALAMNIPTPQLNVGNLHYGPDKCQLLPHVAVTARELELLRDFSTRVPLDFRSVPAENARGIDELLQ